MVSRTKAERLASHQALAAEIQRKLDLDIAKLAIAPEFEGGDGDNTRTSIQQTDFINVSDTVGPSQTGGSGGDTTPPSQVLDLNATAINDTVIGLTWTANSEPDLNNYNVYRGTTPGFTVTLGITSPALTPSTNSVSDTGRTASTTYYYKVSAVDTSANIGALSVEDSATTLAPGAIAPSLEYHFDSIISDSSGFAHLVSGSNSNGYILPGVFGTAGWRCNFPVQPPVIPDNIKPGGATSAIMNIPTLQMDTSVGFSLAFWLNPQDISALSFRRVIAEKADDINNKWSIQLDSSGILYFFVKKAGTDYKRQVSGFTTGSWQHVGATFNGATNTVALYRNAVAGIASTATTQYPYEGQDWFILGCRASGGPDGSDFDTHYEGYYDEFRYYKSVVLTPTQVTNLKNTNAP